MAETLSVPRGILRSWEVEARDERGQVVTDFVPGDALESTIWAGDDTPLLASPTVAWIDASTGLIKLTIPGGVSEALAPGTYRMEVVVVPASTLDRIQILEARLVVTERAGESEAEAVYTDYNALLVYAGWLGQYQELSDQAGFAEQRARARQWVDRVVLARYQGWLGRHRPWEGFGWTAGIVRPSTLEAALDRGGLRVTHRVREMCALYAAALIQVGQLSDAQQEGFSAHARLARDRAFSLTEGWIAEVDTSDPLDDVIDLHIGEDLVWSP